MNVLDSVRIVLYRCHEKGLEVLLINPELKEDPQIWRRLPEGTVNIEEWEERIDLDSYKDAEGNVMRTIAIEADWHEIPSVRGIIKHDMKRLGNKVKKVITPTLENCNYVSVKKALQVVLPHEYQALKELKDIIIDRNLSRSI